MSQDRLRYSGDEPVFLRIGFAGPLALASSLILTANRRGQPARSFALLLRVTIRALHDDDCRGMELKHYSKVPSGEASRPGKQTREEWQSG